MCSRRDTQFSSCDRIVPLKCCGKADKAQHKAGMETSSITPSFLCFLPERECTPTNFIYFNGMSESNGVQNFSTKPSSLAKKNCLNVKLDSPDRLLNASAEAGSVVGNGFVENRVPLAESLCQKEVSKIGSSAVTMEKSRGKHEELDLATRTAVQSFNKAESESVKAAECSSHDNLGRGLEEEDDLAFEITEFFNAFRDGKEHMSVKLREKLNSMLSDSSLDPRCSQLGAIANLKSTDDQSICGKPGMPGYEQNMGGMYPRSSSADRSGKWNGLLEADAFSTTFSGPLTVSGPISFSGHPGHAPYSGSVSHRSDSSTASTHSFAFPILPCEWNSSPVKMPQPDKRFTEKGWKQRLCSILCCCK